MMHVSRFGQRRLALVLALCALAFGVGLICCCDRPVRRRIIPIVAR